MLVRAVVVHMYGPDCFALWTLTNEPFDDPVSFRAGARHAPDNPKRVAERLPRTQE